MAAPNPDHKLIPGLTANLTIYVTQEKDITVVPAQAFRFSPHHYPDADNIPAFDENVPQLNDGQKLVWKVSDGRLIPVAVNVGVSNGIDTQILSGLNRGDEIAIEYAVPQSEAGADENQSERSPFAPRPPQRKK